MGAARSDRWLFDRPHGRSSESQISYQGSFLGDDVNDPQNDPDDSRGNQYNLSHDQDPIMIQARSHAMIMSKSSTPATKPNRMIRFVVRVNMMSPLIGG